MTTRIRLLIAVLFFFAIDECAAQSTFDQIRADVRAPKERNDASRQRSACVHGRYGHCSECDDDSSFGEALIEGLLTGLFTSNDEQDVEYEIEAPRETPAFFFAHYPYADGYDGYLMREDFVPARPQTGAIRIRTHYASDFDSIDRWTTSLLIERTSRIGFEGEITYLTEQLPNLPQDELLIGDANLVWRTYADPTKALRVGLGVNWLDDATATDIGINGTVLFDWFPRKPFTISSQFDVGTIRSATTVHLETSIGLSWEHIEVFGGFDYRRIGRVDLAGPMIGVRGWW